MARDGRLRVQPRNVKHRKVFALNYKMLQICNNETRYIFVRLIEDNTAEGTVVHSLETGDGVIGDILSGFLKPVNEQVSIAFP